MSKKSYLHARFLGLLLLMAACFPGGESPPQARVKQVPLELSVVGGSETADRDAWALFDRSISSGWQPEGESIIARFDSKRRLSLLKVWGPVFYRLEIEREDGSSIPGWNDIELSSAAAGWTSYPLPAPEEVDAVQVRFVPLGGESGEIPELEFWGEGELRPLRPDARPVDIASSVERASALFSFAGEPNSARLQSAVGDDCASFRFSMQGVPALYSRTVLSFEAAGLFRESGLSIYLNGYELEGQWLSGGGFSFSKYALDIPGAHLVPGGNEINLCLPSESGADVSIQNISLIGSLDEGQNFISNVHSSSWKMELGSRLVDGDLSTELLVEDVTLQLSRFVQVDSIVLNTIAPLPLIESISCKYGSEKMEELKILNEKKHTGERGQLIFEFIKSNEACSDVNIKFTSAARISELNLIGSGTKEPIDWGQFHIRAAEHYGENAILQGYISTPSNMHGIIRLQVNGEGRMLPDGSFSELLFRDDVSKSEWTVEMAAILPDGSELNHQVILLDSRSALAEAQANSYFENNAAHRKFSDMFGLPGEKVTKSASLTEDTLVFLGSKVGVKIPAGAAHKPGTAVRSSGGGDTFDIGIKQLEDGELPPLDPLLINVTAPVAEAFEFTPHGTQFSPAAEVIIPYNPELIPETANPSDIKTYFYDEKKQKWEALPTLNVNSAENTVTSETNHFTVMINAVLAIPENPSMFSVNQNSLSDLSVADPTAGVQMIAPPVANQMGDAVAVFPMWLPSGRGKYSPSLSLNYSSASGNSWTGLGWSLPQASISIDTQNGVPRYNLGGEPYYLLNGSRIVPAPDEENGPSCSDGTTHTRFRPQQESSFHYIMRCGTLPTQPYNPVIQDNESYHWEIIDTDGTRFFYGEKSDARLASYRAVSYDPERVGIFSWHLQRVQDIHGNITVFEYLFDLNYPTETKEGWTQIYLKNIKYTAHIDEPTNFDYQIDFGMERERSDALSSGRSGFKILNRFILKNINVSYSGQVIRSYVLKYSIGEFNKTLLQKIIVTSGCTSRGNAYSELSQSCDDSFFYEHLFEYEKEEGGFDEMSEWPIISNDFDDTQYSDFSLMNNNSGFTNMKVKTNQRSLLTGLSFFSNDTSGLVGLSVSHAKSSRLELVGFYDVNSDGLADQVFYDENDPNKYKFLFTLCSASTNNCVMQSELPQSDLIYGDNFSFFDVDGILDRLGFDKSKNWSAGPQVGVGLASAGAGYSHTKSESEEFIFDINGDGIIDKIVGTDVLIGHRCRDGICFGFEEFNSFDQIEHDNDNDLTEIYEDVLPFNLPQNPIKIWTAPFDGTVNIDAEIQKIHAGGEDGVIFSIFKNGIQIGNNISIHAENTFINSWNDSIHVNKGDELVFSLSTQNDVPSTRGELLDVVSLNINVEYEDYCIGEECFPLNADDLLSVDPVGLKIFSFNSKTDFRLAGGSPFSLNITRKGKFKFKGRISKSITSDDVSICIQKISNIEENIIDLNVSCDDSLSVDNVENVYSLDAQDFPAEFELIKDIETADIAVEPGDVLIVRVESDFSIDPNDISFDFFGYFTSICENNICHHTSIEEQRGTTQHVYKDFAPYFPIAEERRSTPLLTTKMPEDGILKIQGILISEPDAIAAIRSDHRVIYKSELSGVDLIDVEVDVNEGEYIAFEVKMKSDNEFSIFTPLIVELNERTLNLHVNEFSENNDKKIKLSDFFSGGYRNWKFTFWRGNIDLLFSLLIDNALLQSNLSDLMAQDLSQFDAANSSENNTSIVKFFQYFAPAIPVWLGTQNTEFQPAWMTVSGNSFHSSELSHAGRSSGSFPVGFYKIEFSGNEDDSDSIDESDDIEQDITTLSGVKNSISKNFSGSLSISGLPSLSYSRGKNLSKTEIIDINGDGIIDVVTPDKIIISSMLREGQTNPSLVQVIDNWLINDDDNNTAIQKSISTSFGIGLGTSIVKTMQNPGGYTRSVDSFSGKRDQSITLNRSQIKEDLFDINGDGLPDRVRYVDDTIFVRLNLGSMLGVEEVWHSQLWNNVDELKNESELNPFWSFISNTDLFDEITKKDNLRYDTTISVSTKFSHSIGLGNDFISDFADKLTDVSVILNSFSISIDATSTVTRNSVGMYDINGDGLIDYLFKKSGTPIYYQLNTGSGFAAPREWDTPSWQNELSFLSSINTNWFTDDLPIVGADVLSGNGRFSLRPENSQLAVSVRFCILTPIGCVVVEPSFSRSKSNDMFSMSLIDINGDGTLDHVLRKHDNNSILVKKNKLTGKSNLLKKIHNPLGGKISLSYARDNNSFDSPSRKILLSEVEIDDNVDFDQEYEIKSPNKKNRFKYENGFYSRSEKEFYGFKKIIQQEIVNDPDVDIGVDIKNTFVQIFENKDIATHGLLLESRLFVGPEVAGAHPCASGNCISELTYEYETEQLHAGMGICLNNRHPLMNLNACSVFYSKQTKVETKEYEGINFKKKEEFNFAYDSYGHVLLAKNTFDDSTINDDIFIEMNYDNFLDKWILGLPNQIKVRSQSGTGTLLRKKSAIYSPVNGSLLSIKSHYDQVSATDNNDFNDISSEVKFFYNEYGNISIMISPASDGFIPRQNSNCGNNSIPSIDYRFEYFYDNTNKFIKQIDKHYVTSEGQSLHEYSIQYVTDPKFENILISRDANEVPIIKEYDQFGRLIKVFGPDDINTAAVSLSYSDLPKLPAIGISFPSTTTSHFIKKPNGIESISDSQMPTNAIKTIVFVNGLGNVIESKKTSVVNGVLGFTVQGPNSYDLLTGKIEKIYLPFFAEGTSESFELIQSTAFTQYEYDSLDRIIRIIYPDSSQEEFSYLLSEHSAVSGMQYIKMSKNSNGYTTTSISDSRGYLLAMIEPSLAGQPGSVTRYHYLPTGELSKVIDNNGNETTLNYDLRGLWLSVNNPDTGLIEQFYDRAGHVVRRIEPNHRNINTSVEYGYEGDFLRCIDYPSKPDVFYTYGDALASGLFTRGRLLSVLDETGSKYFTYGNMGEITSVTKIFSQMIEGETSIAPQTLKTIYDNFGRLLSITYPDGERLNYFYNAGGELVKMEGSGIAAGSPPVAWTRTYISGLEYNLFGQRTKATFGNGVTTTWSYDVNNQRVINQKSINGQGKKYQDINYQFDSRGNPTRIESQVDIPVAGEIGPMPGVETFTYDESDRLLAASGCRAERSGRFNSYAESFSYDAIHNVRQKIRANNVRSLNCLGPILSSPSGNNFNLSYKYASAAPHRATGVGQLTLQYDLSGNVTRRTEGSFVQSLTWDDDNRLVSVTNSADPSKRLYNAYDAAGLRVWKNSAFGGDTLFISQFFDIKDRTKALKHYFAGGVRVAVKSTNYNASSNGNASETNRTSPDGVIYFHLNHLGSANILTRDNDTADPYQYIEYFPDGDSWIERIANNTPEHGYKFSGKPFDPETGWYDHGQRFYDPKTSLWLGVDPLLNEEPGKLGGSPFIASAYGYGFQNPMKFIDPDGRNPFAIGSAIWEIGASIFAGAGIGAATHTVVSGVSGQPVTVGGVAGAAVTGGLIAPLSGLSAARTIIAGGLAGVAGNLTTAMIDGTSFDPTDISTLTHAFVLGAAGSAAGLAAAKAATAVAARAVGASASAKAIGQSESGLYASRKPLDNTSYKYLNGVNPEEGRANCGACARAVDERFAAAKNHPGGDANAKAPLEGYVHPKDLGVGDDFPLLNAAEVIDKIKSLPPNAARIIVARQPGQVDHAFNALNDDGSVVFVDGQLGLLVELGMNYKYYLLEPFRYVRYQWEYLDLGYP